MPRFQKGSEDAKRYMAEMRMKRGKGMWDWADPKKNGVAKAFDPKQNGTTQFFENDVKNALQDNIRPIIHGAVGTAISGITGVPMLGTLIGQAGLNQGINEGLDKANLGFGVYRNSAGIMVDSNQKEPGYIHPITGEKFSNPYAMMTKINSDLSKAIAADRAMRGMGFFDNIGNAFTTTWNQPPRSNDERNALKFFYNDFLPTMTAPINIIAPPVGKVADVGFSELRKKQLGEGKKKNKSPK